MSRYRVVLAPEIADVVRSLPPDLKRTIRNTLDALGEDPSIGLPLRGELQGLWRYRARRFRIVYAVDATARTVQVVAIGPRRTIYDDLKRRRRRRRRIVESAPTR